MFTSLLLLFFLNIFYERAMSSPEKKHLKITIIIIIIINQCFSSNKLVMADTALNAYIT